MSRAIELAKKLPNKPLRKDAAIPLAAIPWAIAGLGHAARWAAMRAAPAAIRWGTQRAAPWVLRQGAKLIPATAKKVAPAVARTVAQRAAPSVARAAAKTVAPAAARGAGRAGAEAAKGGVGRWLGRQAIDLGKFQAVDYAFNALFPGKNDPAVATTTGGTAATDHRVAPSAPVRARARARPRLNVRFASLDHDRRIAFDAGIEELCKRAQLDREDQAAMFDWLEKGAEPEALRDSFRSSWDADFAEKKGPDDFATLLAIQQLRKGRAAAKKQENEERATENPAGGAATADLFHQALQRVGSGHNWNTGWWGATRDALASGQPYRRRMYTENRDKAREYLLKQHTPEDIRAAEKLWMNEYIPDEKLRHAKYQANIAAWNPGAAPGASAAPGTPARPKTEEEMQRDLDRRIDAMSEARIQALERGMAQRELQRAGDPQGAFDLGRQYQIEDAQKRLNKHLAKGRPNDPKAQASYDRILKQHQGTISRLEQDRAPAEEYTGEGGPARLRAGTAKARNTAIEQALANVTIRGMSPWEAVTSAAGNATDFRGDIMKALQERLPREHGRMIDPKNPNKATVPIEGWIDPGNGPENNEITLRNQAAIERAKITGQSGPTGQTGPQATATPAYTPASPSDAVPGSAQQAAQSIGQAAAGVKQVAQAPKRRGQIIASPEDIEAIKAEEAQRIADGGVREFNSDLIGEQMGGGDEPVVSNVGTNRRRKVPPAAGATPPAAQARTIWKPGDPLPIPRIPAVQTPAQTPAQTPTGNLVGGTGALSTPGATIPTPPKIDLKGGGGSGSGGGSSDKPKKIF